MQEEGKFARIAVRPTAQRKVTILATLYDIRIYRLLDSLIEAAWKEAKKAGLVTDNMLKREPENEEA